jgi:competence protein ComEC
MVLILLSLTLAALSWQFHWPENLLQISLTLNARCLQVLPQNLENLKSLEALVCGKNIENLELKHLLIQTSLIHIFIVSGSHFLFLHKIFAAILRPRWLSFLLLGIYALTTLCQPPAIRSLIFLLLVELSRRFKFFTASAPLILASALLTLALFPAWLASRSMLMSLLAALVIAVCNEFWGRQRHSWPAVFATQGAVYVVMGVCLWGFSNLHPLGILLNILLAPLIGLVLFPTGLLTVVLPFCGFIFDELMNGLIYVLSRTQEVLTLPSLASPVGLTWQWGLFLGLLVGSYRILIQRRRQRRSIHEV